MDKPTENPDEKSDDKKSNVPIVTVSKKAADLDAKYEKLITVLNRLGYYPQTREDAKKIAKELLDRGWEE